MIPSISLAMDDPDENTWLAALINKLNKQIDKVGYATNNKALRAYNDALNYGPGHSKTTALSLDDKSKKVIKKIIPRMMAGRVILQKIVESNNPDHPDLRAMLKAKKDMPGFFSECDDAILLGLLNWKRNTHKRELQDYEDYVETQNSQASLLMTPKIEGKKNELEVSVSDLKRLALKQYNWWNPYEIVAGTLNYLSKHYFFPIDHLTNTDSRDLCTGMLYFNPVHPKHNIDPELTLNPDKEWHRWLVRKVIDRENIFLGKLYYNLVNNKPKQVMQLSRPKVETPNSTIPVGIFSQVTDSLSSGFLSFTIEKEINNIPDDPKVLEERLKQEEARKKAEEENAKTKAAEEQEKQRKLAEEQRVKDEITQRLVEKVAAARVASEKKEKEENEHFQNLLSSGDTPTIPTKPLPQLPAKPAAKQLDSPQQP